MRVFALLLLLMPLLAQPAAARPRFVNVQVRFDSEPEGAVITELRGNRVYTVGLTGQPINLPVFPDPNALLTFFVHLDGYEDVPPIQVQSRLLLDAHDLVHLPDDGPVHLLPKNALVPIRTFVSSHTPALVVTASVLALVLFGGVLPQQRRLMQRARRLQTLRSGDTSDDPNVGHQFGNWLIVRLLGRGGCASVYEAVPWDSLQARDRVALKILHKDATTGEFKERFKREVRICKELNHPNIVRILDWDLGRVIYMSMELVEGQSLRKL
ncbi:MAG: protein kinase domain-containing protein, partial [Candidatus Xenobia bacterium]